MMPIGLAAASAAAYGVSDYLGGVASRRTRALRVICVSYPLSVVIVALVALCVGGSATPAGLAWGTASGVASGLAVWSFYVALSRGPMSVISPLTAVLCAGIPMVVGLAMGERPGARALIGAVIAIVATMLVSLEDRAVENRASDAPTLRFTPAVAGLTLVSGVAFATFFILLGQVPPGEGLWPVLASRAGASAVVLLVAVSVRESLMPGRQLLLIGAVIAVVDVVANSLFYFATQSAMLSLVSVIASLYPAFTVLLALTHGGERVRSIQVAGMLLAAVAVALITLR